VDKDDKTLKTKRTKLSRWINTKTVWEWQDGQYVEVESQGYEYDGQLALAHSPANTGLDAIQFYDSANTTSIAAQDTDPVTLEVDTTYVVRVRIYNDSGDTDESNDTYQIQYNNTTQVTNWQPINGTSSHVRAANPTGITDGTAITSGTLTGASGSFINGEEIEDGVSAAITISAASYTEFHYGITLQSADVANGDNINLRILRGTTTLDFETVAPSITVTEATPTTVTPSVDAFTLSDGTLQIQQDQNVTPVVDSFTLTGGTLTVTQAQGTAVDPIADTFTLTDGTLTIRAEQEARITPIADAFTLSDGTLTITAETETRVTPIADTFTLTDGTLSVNAETSITAVPDSFTLSDGSLTVSQGTNTVITMIADSFTLTDGTLTVTAENETRITPIADSFNLTDGVLSVNAETVISPVTDNFTLTDGTLSVSQAGAIAISPIADSLTLTDGSLTVSQSSSAVTGGGNKKKRKKLGNGFKGFQQVPSTYFDEPEEEQEEQQTQRKTLTLKNAKRRSKPEDIAKLDVIPRYNEEAARIAKENEARLRQEEVVRLIDYLEAEQERLAIEELISQQRIDEEGLLLLLMAS
jgi:hypothetical protein